MSPDCFRVDCIYESVESSRVILWAECRVGMHESGQIGQLPVPDADRSSRPLDKLLGGGGVGGGLQKIFFRPLGPHSGLKIGKRDPGPLPWIRHRLRNTEIYKHWLNWIWVTYVRIKLTAKTVDEDPGSCKRWISRKENTFSLTLTILILTCSKNHKLIPLEKIHSSRLSS